MSVQDLKATREQLIAELAEVIANKFHDSIKEYLELPFISHEQVTLVNFEDHIEIKFWMASGTTALTKDGLIKLFLSVDADGVEKYIAQLISIEQDLCKQFHEWNENEKLRDVINKYN